MNVGRNEPCPCGSGKKYKRCCEPTDLAVGQVFRLGYPDLHPGIPDAAEHLALARTEPWEAGLIPFLPSESDPGSGPGMVAVTGGGLILYVEALDRTPSEPDLTALLLERAIRMTRAGVGGLPPTIRVQEEAVAERLRAASSLTSVAIAVSADLPELDELSRGAVEQWAGAAAPGPAVSLPDTWSEWGWPTALVAGLFRAAAAYWRAAPWGLLDNLQILSARTPDGGGTTWTACILGNGGEEYGLALYREREDFLAQVESELPSEAWNALRGPVLSLLFEPRASLPRVMQKEILARGWEVAGPDAHPQLTALNPPEGGVPQAWAEELVAVLRSVPRFVQRQRVLLESGREPEAPVVWNDPETGVELTYTGHLPLANDLLWEPPAALGSALPAGPRADPSAALRGGGDEDPDGLYDRELAVVRRFEEFLVRAGRSRTTVEKHVGNATWLIDCLAGYLGVPLVACTEYDLRVFLYDWFPRKVRATETIALSLPGSLARFFAFLAEHEGLEFPWATEILRDREAFEIRYRSFPGGFWWDEPVQEWQQAVYEDLEARVLTPDWEMAGGRQWGETMGMTEHRLRRELERRWLLWRDQVIAAGEREPEAVYQALVARQREWETAPYPEHAGRSPVELIVEERRAERKGRKGR